MIRPLRVDQVITGLSPPRDLGERDPRLFPTALPILDRLSTSSEKQKREKKKEEKERKRLG